MSRVALLTPPLAAALGAGAPGAGSAPGNTANGAPLSLLPSRSTFARSRTTETVIVAVPGFGDVVRKRWWWPGVRDRVKGAFRTTFMAPSPARREHDALLRLRALTAGPFAPAPLGIIEERRCGVLVECTLVLDLVRGGTDLATWMRDEGNPATRAQVLADLARRVRGMHDAGLADCEMHPRNVVVQPSLHRTWKIDVAKQRGYRGPAPRHAAIDDLACLDVGISRFATAAERRAFLAEYAANRTPANGTDAATDSDVARLDAEVATRRMAHDARESARLPTR